jgi:hypothetical protein
MEITKVNKQAAKKAKLLKNIQKVNMAQTMLFMRHT